VYYHTVCCQLADVEKNSGSVEMLQQQLLDVKSKLEDSERLVQQKQDVWYAAILFIYLLWKLYSTYSDKKKKVHVCVVKMRIILGCCWLKNINVIIETFVTVVLVGLTGS